MRLPIQALQAILIKPLGQEEEAWFRSTIVDFQVHRELVVSLPSPKDRLDWKPTPKTEEGAGEDEELTDTLFSRGTQLEVQISFPDGIRRFSSIVRKLDLSFGGSLYLDWPTEGTRIQRREHVRVEVRFPAAVRYVDGNGLLRSMEGDTIDLSAGGSRLQLAEPIPDDTEVELQIGAEALAQEPLQGRVVRSGEVDKQKVRRGLSWWVAIEFVAMDPRTLKEMTQLVVDIQRQQMKRSD
jgi:hypothetical protein